MSTEHCNWEDLIQVNGEDVTLHQISEAEVDTSSYPSPDVTDTQKTIRMFITSWMDMPRLFRSMGSLGQYTQTDIFGISYTSETLVKGYFIEHTDGEIYDIIEVLTERVLGRAQYVLVKMSRRES